MIKKKILEKIKKSLLLEKEELINKKYSTEVDVDGDEIDEIQGSLIASISSQLSTRDAQKLKQINFALKKIDDDIYGVCEDCQELISEKRLEVNPYFSTCISCAEQREMDLKRKRL